MARRASSQSNLLTTLSILVAVVVLLGGGYFLLNRKPAGFSAPALPVDAFLNNANSLRGNLYSVEGRVNSIRPRDDAKFVHLRVEGTSGEQHLFVVVPNSLNTVNIEREQKYAFKVEVEKGGIPKALELMRL